MKLDYSSYHILILFHIEHDISFKCGGGDDEVRCFVKLVVEIVGWNNDRFTKIILSKSSVEG